MSRPASKMQLIDREKHSGRVVNCSLVCVAVILLATPSLSLEREPRTIAGHRVLFFSDTRKSASGPHKRLSRSSHFLRKVPDPLSEAGIEGDMASSRNLQYESPTLSPSLGSTRVGTQSGTGTGVFTSTPSSIPNATAAQVATQETTQHSTEAPTTAANSSTHSSSSFGTTTFYVVADSPYNTADADRLLNQMTSIPQDAEFVVHLGDIRNAEGKPQCTLGEYQAVSDILRQSCAPVFITIGDNDWNDCPNAAEGLSFWKTEFLEFYNRYWNTGYLNVQPMPGRPENLMWIYKGTLFLLIDMPGGTPLNWPDWSTQLSDEVQWSIQNIKEYKASMDRRGLIGQVVIFAHADPNSNHAPFFTPLTDFISTTLNNQLPILYMNGDEHVWKYQPDFYQESSFLRIMLTGETANPPLKMTIQGGHSTHLPLSEIFVYDRQL